MIRRLNESDKNSVSKLTRVINDIKKYAPTALSRHGIVDIDEFDSWAHKKQQSYISNLLTDLENIKSDIQSQGSAKFRSKVIADLLCDIGFNVVEDGYSFVAESVSRNESFEIHPLKTAKTYRPDYDSFDLFSYGESTKNQFLGRFVADCEYFLGNGNGYEGHLWAGSVEEQIDLMRKLYDDIRPDWLSEKQIDDYEDAMLAVKYNKNESIRRNRYRGLIEGDASKKTNYAVIVRDMNKGTYNLYTGTKADCEQLLSDLDAFESFANECDDENEYFAEEEYIIDLLSSYECLPEIYRNMIDRNDNYNVGLHYGDYLGGMIHIINADNPIDLYI